MGNLFTTLSLTITTHHVMLQVAYLSNRFVDGNEGGQLWDLLRAGVLTEVR